MPKNKPDTNELMGIIDGEAYNPEDDVKIGVSYYIGQEQDSKIKKVAKKMKWSESKLIRKILNSALGEKKDGK